MLLIVGFLIVIGSMMGGFLMAGGNLILLVHVSEFVVIGGIALGVLVIASPPPIIKGMIADLKHVFAAGSSKKEDFIDLYKMLYELFSLGRKNGLVALDEHVSAPATSSILSKYPSVIKNHERLEFLCNALRPVIDGKVKPEQLMGVLEVELDALEEESHGPVGIISLVADSLPGIGIVAAVLGIINTMSSIAEGPEKVGEKVAAALTGTFLGVYVAYGFISPLAKRMLFMHKAQLLYLQTMANCISGFAKGLTPMIAIEISRRGLDSSVKPKADELESILKALPLP